MPNATVAKSPVTVAAKRGDLVLISRQSRSTSLYRGMGWYESLTLGEVTSVTRDGIVKKYKTTGNSIHSVRSSDTVSIAPAHLFSHSVAHIVDTVRITTSDDVRAQLRSFLLQRID
jgi:hypothetical protein